MSDATLSLRALRAMVAGLLVVGGALGGLIALSTPAARHDADDWRPRCARAQGWDTIDVRAQPRTQAQPDVLLYGIDASLSNDTVTRAQVQAAIDHAGGTRIDSAVGMFLISDDSTASAVPDMPFEHAEALSEPVVEGLPCWPNCPRDTLGQQRCGDQLAASVASRTAQIHADQVQLRDRLMHERKARIAAWAATLESLPPSNSTTLSRFFAKIADLPVVRRNPTSVTLVVLSDLAESKSPERGHLVAAIRELKRSGRCPPANELPTLSGVRIVLLQTLASDADRHWGEDWRAYLTCTGADVELHRYTTAIPIEDYLSPRSRT